MPTAASSEINGAQAIVRMLEAYGVKHVFGVPGDTSVPLYQALYERRDAIAHVLARDERSAGFMADVYARLSHKPGVCECPSGAGALYSAPGIAEANASSIPILLLTSGVSLAGEGKGTITEMDHHVFFESISKWSNFLKLAVKIPETLRRAFRVATSGCPGAVHLAFPTETVTDRIPLARISLHAETECTAYPSMRFRGSPDAITRVARRLKQARRPVLIVGGGANHSQARREVQELAERIQAPVVTTISGQGIMPDQHALALGVIGDNGYHPHAIRAVEEADALLYVGCKMGSVSTVRWTLPSPKPGRTLLQVDINPRIIGNNCPVDEAVVGDARLVLEDVLAELGPARRTDTEGWTEDLNRDRRHFWERAAAVLASDEVPLSPQRVIGSLNRVIREPAVVIADAGTATPYVTRYLKLNHSRSRFIIPRAYGGLGYAIPGVVGAWLARPEARPVGLFGDGSLGMSCGELETLVRCRVPAVLIHFNNGSFGWIKTLQKIHSESRYLSVDFTPLDASRIAEAFGLRAFRVETPDQLEDSLRRAFAAGEPCLIDVLSRPIEDRIPPVFSWLKDSGLDPLSKDPY
jgi:acetolactate synthase I/II/III large subunit